MGAESGVAKKLGVPGVGARLWDGRAGWGAGITEKMVGFVMLVCSARET